MDECAEFYDIWASKIANFKGLEVSVSKTIFFKQNCPLAGRVVNDVSILKNEDCLIVSSLIENIG